MTAELRRMIAELEADAHAFAGKASAIVDVLKEYADARDAMDHIIRHKTDAELAMAGVIVEAAFVRLSVAPEGATVLHTYHQ